MRAINFQANIFECHLHSLLKKRLFKGHIYFFLFYFIQFHFANSQLVNEYIDLQIHTTMHVPYSFFGKGLLFFDEKNPPDLSYKHQFNNVNYANFFKNNKGLRIIANGSLNGEYIANPKKARRIILKQINYVNKFAKDNSEFFVVAKTSRFNKKMSAKTVKK